MEPKNLNIKQILNWNEILSIDLVRQCVLNQMEFSDLLTFRQLSQHFQNISFSTLRQRSKIHFKDYSNSKTNKSLKQFTKSWQNFRSHYFPCISFIFEFSAETQLRLDAKILEEKSLQKAFSKFGPHIEKLSFKWKFPIKLKKKRREELSVLEELRNILCKTPNLFYLYFDYPAKCKWEEDPRSRRSVLKLTDPEFIKIEANSHSLDNKPNLMKLKIFEYRRYPLAKILEGIVRWAPNLKQVFVESHCEQFLASPVNRLHLTKYLMISPPFTELEIFENVPFAIPDPFGEPILQLERIWLNLKYFNRVEGITTGGLNEEIQSRLLRLFNRILASSCKTLKEIRWDGVTHLGKIEWPKLMPNFKSLIMREPFNLFEISLFPEDFKWSERFPKLGSILLRGFTDKDISRNFAGIRSRVRLDLDNENITKGGTTRTDVNRMCAKKSDFYDWILIEDSSNDEMPIAVIYSRRKCLFRFVVGVILLFVFLNMIAVLRRAWSQ